MARATVHAQGVLVFNFVFDRRNDARPYPNLAPMMHNPNESYHGMGDSWPFITPCRLLYYAQDHDFPVCVSYLDEPIPDQAWYPVGLGFFHFELDYFAMMSQQVRDLLKSRTLRVLFYYHEGDSPYHEKTRLDELCSYHDLPVDCYKFVSGNTQADCVPGFCWFPDHELFYWRNSVKWNSRSMPGTSFHNRLRTREFTALNRIHKWWRATIMVQLLDQGYLDNSYWSFNNVDQGDQWNDNPIEIGTMAGLEQRIKNFVARGPYTCDHFSSTEHNSHWMFVPEHYDNAYCHLILETLYDAEQSGGAFLTEKTFKPIRHAQPFVLFGTVDSLTTLRRLGYKTFDHQIDNGYDSESNNTQRFLKTMVALQKLRDQNLHELYLSCRDQIIHNQELFLASKYNRLSDLCEKLNND